jgi:CMP/dCMP kinase
VIAIDGPAASGKTTLARRLASALDLPFLDTGLIYRAAARRVLDAGHDCGDEERAVEAARAVTLDDLRRPDLGEEAVGDGASRVAAMAPVRLALLEVQRRFAKASSGAVLAGRDIGTVVCPDATHKIFVTAVPEARAQRRYEELRARGVGAIYGRVLEDLRKRDARDAERAFAPMRPAEDAYVLDTTGLDADAAFRAAHAFVTGADPDGAREGGMDGS